MRQHDLIAVLDGTHHAAPMQEMLMVPQDGLTAVLCATPRPAFRMPKSRRDVLSSAAQFLRLQESCLPLGTVLPAEANASLCVEGTSRFLQANQPVLSRLMQRFSGQVQVQVTVRWDESSVLVHFRDTPEIAPLFTATKPTPQMLTQAIGQLAQRLSAQIDDLLSPVATEMSPLPIAPGVLWNGVVLVAGHSLDALSSAVEAIDAIWTEGFQIRQIGPAPIASFALIGVEQVSGTRATDALRRFGLATARRTSLMAAVADARAREEIRVEAIVAEAAARLSHPEHGFALLRVRNDGSSAVGPARQEVA